MERCDLDLLLLNKQEFTLISLLQNRYHPIVQGQRARKCSVGVLHGHVNVPIACKELRCTPLMMWV